MDHKIFVSVQGGVAEVCEETVPAGILVEILDFDSFAANPERELFLVVSRTPRILGKEPRAMGSLWQRLSLSSQGNDLIAFWQGFLPETFGARDYRGPPIAVHHPPQS